MLTTLKPAITWHGLSSASISSGLTWLTFANRGDDFQLVRITDPAELATIARALYDVLEVFERRGALMRDIFLKKCHITVSVGIQAEPERIQFVFSDRKRFLMIEKSIVYDLQRWLAHISGEKPSPLGGYDCEIRPVRLTGDRLLISLDNGLECIPLTSERPLELQKLLLAEVAIPYDLDVPGYRSVTVPLERDGGHPLTITSDNCACSVLSYVRRSDGITASIECSRSTMAKLALTIESTLAD